MAETFTFENTNQWDDLPGRALITVMTNYCEEHGGDILSVFKMKPGEVNLNVVFTVNGVEVSLRKVLDQWHKQRDEWLVRAARKLLEDRFGKISNMLENVERSIKDEIFNVFPDLRRDEDHW